MSLIIIMELSRFRTIFDERIRRDETRWRARLLFIESDFRSVNEPYLRLAFPSQSISLLERKERTWHRQIVFTIIRRIRTDITSHSDAQTIIPFLQCHIQQFCSIVVLTLNILRQSKDGIDTDRSRTTTKINEQIFLDVSKGETFQSRS